MIFPKCSFRSDLAAKLEKAKDRPPMTPAELQLQRINFVYGNSPKRSGISWDDVAADDYAKHGNLAEIEARLADLEALVAALQKLEGDSLEAIMEVIGEGKEFAAYNSGKQAMRKWFLDRISTALTPLMRQETRIQKGSTDDL